MHKKTLLVGNDINNIVPNNSWKDLLTDIVNFCSAQKLVTDFENKPFPLLYEEIFLKSLKKKHRNERELKNFISKKVSSIESNQIHERIRRFETKDIITTNYEFALEGQRPERNSAVVDERLYSVFRHYRVAPKNYWHIHGDCRIPSSINLGFEHYGGQLQQIRNYVVTGTNYKSKEINKLPLVRRLEIKELKGQSWIELFFTSDIYIFGLSLDFVETDLWWLLTYRARQLFYKKRLSVNNKIYYFIPKEYREKSRGKIDLLNANGVIVLDTISGYDKLKYYHNVLDRIEEGIR
jgi:hypothetical protein